MSKSRRPPTSTLIPYTTLFRSHLSVNEWTSMQANAQLASLVAAATPRVATFEPGAELVPGTVTAVDRSEEHTSELQSQSNLVCRLLLENKNKSTLRHRIEAICS